MTEFVALFRGINVGGKHSLPMQDLREILSSLGCENVQTYIQSGNAVFSSPADAESLSGQIRGAIDERFGFAPQVLLLSAARFRAVVAANPFPDAVDAPKSLHVSFLAEPPADPDLQTLDELRAPAERFQLSGDAFYLHAPDGIGRSRLAAKVERCLGVAATGRNWRTVSKLAELLSHT